MCNHLFRLHTLVKISLLLVTPPLLAQSLAQTEKAEENTSQPINAAVITVTGSPSQPYTIISSPKTPRQPIPASDGADYLQTIAGFSQIRNGGTNGDPVFRGMFGSRLRILTNGTELNGACGGRMDAPSAYIAPQGYDLLTLIKGPQTVLWGPGNSAGTVLFQRAQPDFTDHPVVGDISGTVVPHQRLEGNIDMSVGSEKGYHRIIGSQAHADDYRDGKGSVVPSKWDKWNYDVIVGWTPTRDTLAEFTTGSGNGQARYAARGMDGAQFKRQSHSLRLEQRNISDTLDKVEALFFYHNADHVMDNFSLRHTTMPKRSSRVERTTMGGRAAANWLFTDFKLQSGVDTRSSWHRARKEVGWREDATMMEMGIFSELTWSQDEQHRVVGGGRLDQHRMNNRTHPGPTYRNALLPAGFIRYEHDVADFPMTLYMGPGYTTRFPDYWELYSPRIGPDNSANVAGKLRAEKTLQLDFGANYHGEKLSSWLSAWVNQINDYILFTYDPINLSNSQVNNVTARTLGAEAGLSYPLSETLKGEANLAWNWAKNQTEQRPLAQIAPPEARLGLTWQQEALQLSGLLRVVQHQHRVALNQGNVAGKDFAQSGAFAVLSVNGGWQINQVVALTSGIDNLLNRNYSEHLNRAGNGGFGYSGTASINEPGRTVWARVNIKF